MAVLGPGQKSARVPLMTAVQPLPLIRIGAPGEAEAAVLARRNDDAWIDLEWLAQAFPRAVHRSANEVAVLPVPVVVDVELAVLKPAVEIVVACVVDMRQELTEAPAPDPILTHRLLCSGVPASVS